MSHPLDSIFRPRSVAVIGASNAPEKFGYIILKNILEAGFRGPVYPVNPKAAEILGVTERHLYRLLQRAKGEGEQNGDGELQ